MWIGGNDPVGINELQKMPMIEYFALADRKIAEEHEKIKNAKKQGSR